MTVVTKFVKDDQFIILEYDGVNDKFKVTASNDELITKWNEFAKREEDREWGPYGHFDAVIDGLEDELGFVRQ